MLRQVVPLFAAVANACRRYCHFLRSPLCLTGQCVDILSLPHTEIYILSAYTILLFLATFLILAEHNGRQKFRYRNFCWFSPAFCAIMLLPALGCAARGPLRPPAVSPGNRHSGGGAGREAPGLEDRPTGRPGPKRIAAASSSQEPDE